MSISPDGIILIRISLFLFLAFLSLLFLTLFMFHFRAGNAMSSPLGSPGGSPFGERKTYKNFERRMSSRFSRQESSTSNSDGEDFRAMARRLSKSSAASSQLIDPAARLAAQKKLEADEKLRLQKEIEAMKDKMNNVETVEKTGFKYDPSKVRGQIEIEIKEAEDAVFEGPEEEKDQEYKEWLEEMMSQGWNEEVKELVSGRKKVTKANLLRARKRSIVRRYSVIVPGVRDEYQLASEEDEYTEEEKLRREVERRFETEVDLNYSIEQLSNDKNWMAEIQELVGAKKKINHHNLSNARKRNIVKDSEQKYPGCTYELNLEPDEYTDVELKRRELDENIEVIRIIVGGTDDVEVIIDSLSKKWIFNLDDLDKQKKKRNKKNIFNHLVRQLIKEAKDKFPDLDYHVDLEDDDYTDEEQRRRDFESATNKIDAEVGGMSVEELVEMYPDLAPRLDEKNRVISKENGVRLLKRDALIRIYGEGDNYMLKYHELSDDCFDLNHRGLALQYINSQMEVVDEKLKDKENFSSNFQDELAYFTSIMAHTSPENVWQFCLNRIKNEAIKLFPDCGIETPIPEYDMTEEGRAFVKLMADFSELDTLLASVPEEILMTESAWVRQRAFLESQRTKVCGKNIITVQKQKLYDEFKRNFPDFDYEEIFPFEEYTYGEMAVMKAQEKQARYNVICEKLNQELTNAKISLDRAHKRSELEGDRLDNHLEESEWKEELGQIKLIDNLPVNRKNLFEFKARNLVALYRKMHQEFDFTEYDEIRHEYETEDEGFITAVGCLTCEIKSRTAFFDSNSEGHSPVKYLSAEGDPQDQIIVAIPYFSDTDTSSVPPSPYDPTKNSFSDLIEEENIANRIEEESRHESQVSVLQTEDVPLKLEEGLSEEKDDDISERKEEEVDFDLPDQLTENSTELQTEDGSENEKVDSAEHPKEDLPEHPKEDFSEQPKEASPKQRMRDYSYSPSAHDRDNDNPLVDLAKDGADEVCDNQPNSTTSLLDNAEDEVENLIDENSPNNSENSPGTVSAKIDEDGGAKPACQETSLYEKDPLPVEQSSGEDNILDVEKTQTLANTENDGKLIGISQLNNNEFESQDEHNQTVDNHTESQANEISRVRENSYPSKGDNIVPDSLPANEIKNSCSDANNTADKASNSAETTENSPLDADLINQPNKDHSNNSIESIGGNIDQILPDQSNEEILDNSMDLTNVYSSAKDSKKIDGHAADQEKVKSQIDLVQDSPVSKNSGDQNDLEVLDGNARTDFDAKLSKDLSRNENDTCRKDSVSTTIPPVHQNDSSDTKESSVSLDADIHKPVETMINAGSDISDQVQNDTVGNTSVEIQIEETEDGEAIKKHNGNDDADKLDFRISEPSRSFIEGPDSFLDNAPSDADSLLNGSSVFGKDLEADQVLSESENIGQSDAKHEIGSVALEQSEGDKTSGSINNQDETKEDFSADSKDNSELVSKIIVGAGADISPRDETKASEEQETDADASLPGESDRPAVLLSQGFDFDNAEITDDLESCTLPAGLMLTPGEPMNSPFPSHGYVSPHKTFDSRDTRENSASPLCNGTPVRDSAYESRSSLKSEDELLQPSGPASPGTNLGIHLQPPDSDGTELENRGSESNETEHTESGMTVPAALKSESFGSDSVFLNSSPSPQLLETADELSETALYSGADDSEVTPACSGSDEKEDVEFSGNDGDTEYSPADESLLNKSSNDPPKQLTLPGRTISQMRKVSSTSGSSEDETDEKKSNRSPKRKKMSGSGSVTPEQHPLLKRQEEYNKRTSILEAKKISTIGRQSLNSDDTPTGYGKDQDDTTPTKPKSSYRPSSLPLRKPVNKSTEGSVTPNFDHIQSSYKPEKPNPLYDRTKYIKVPTLEDKNVAAEPILDGLLPKEFYDQKLSFDLSHTGGSAHSTPKAPKKPRDKSEYNAPTTGHMLWELMKERRLERAEEDNIITDLDLAVS